MKFQVFCYDCGKCVSTDTPSHADFLSFAHKFVNPTHTIYVEEFKLEVVA